MKYDGAGKKGKCRKGSASKGNPKTTKANQAWPKLKYA